MSRLVGWMLAVCLGMSSFGALAQGGPRDIAQAAQNGQAIRIQGVRRSRSAIPRLYTIRRGDTLWDVTGRFYGNPWEWPRLWSYNPEITNPHWIYPMEQLRLRLPAEAEPPPMLPQARVARPRSPREMGAIMARNLGFIDTSVLQTAGEIAGSEHNHMMLSLYDEVYLQFSDDVSGTPRGEYAIFRRVPEEERGEAEEGELVRIFGSVEIVSYDQSRRVAEARIVDALDAIERGMLVAPIPRRYEMVGARVSQMDLETRVIAALDARDMTGSFAVVFLPVGVEQGVQVGHRFFVHRSGDPWRDNLEGDEGQTVDLPDELESYPDEIVAEGRVVDVRANTCTLMVTRGRTAVRVGDRVEMHAGY